MLTWTVGSFLKSVVDGLGKVVKKSRKMRAPRYVKSIVEKKEKKEKKRGGTRNRTLNLGLRTSGKT